MVSGEIGRQPDSLAGVSEQLLAEGLAVLVKLGLLVACRRRFDVDSKPFGQGYRIVQDNDTFFHVAAINHDRLQEQLIRLNCTMRQHTAPGRKRPG